MVVLGYKEKEGESLTQFYNLITTKSAWLKHSVKPWLKTGTEDEPASRPYDAERILHYAAALQLVSSRTTIPVPRLIGFGENDDGTAWIELERPRGVWLDVVRDQGRMPAGKKHVEDGECDECDRIARANARRFITEEVVL